MEISNPFRQCLAGSVDVRNLFGVGNHRQRLRVICGENKEKRKKLKGLEKDLALFASMRFGIDPKSSLAGAVQESLVTEAAELIMRQLQCVRELEEEEAKRQRKQEKKKHKTKSMQTQEASTDHESTKYSGDVPSPKSTEGIGGNAAEAVAGVLRQSSEDHDEQDSSDLALPCTPASRSQKPTFAQKVEVCMGRKCRNSGSPQLLEQIQSLAAKEDNVIVVGCKCLGKCNTSPNVRFSSSNAAPAICPSVRINDFDSLMARFMELK